MMMWRKEEVMQWTHQIVHETLYYFSCIPDHPLELLVIFPCFSACNLFVKYSLYWSLIASHVSTWTVLIKRNKCLEIFSAIFSPIPCSVSQIFFLANKIKEVGWLPVNGSLLDGSTKKGKFLSKEIGDDRANDCISNWFVSPKKPVFAMECNTRNESWEEQVYRCSSLCKSFIHFVCWCFAVDAKRRLDKKSYDMNYFTCRSDYSQEWEERGSRAWHCLSITKIEADTSSLCMTGNGRKLTQRLMRGHMKCYTFLQSFRDKWSSMQVHDSSWTWE